jgi:hypothetical protein
MVSRTESRSALGGALADRRNVPVTADLLSTDQANSLHQIRKPRIAPQVIKLRIRF